MPGMWVVSWRKILISPIEVTNSVFPRSKQGLDRFYL